MEDDVPDPTAKSFGDTWSFGGCEERQRGRSAFWRLIVSIGALSGAGAKGPVQVKNKELRPLLISQDEADR
jgi:hypothetical protein